MRLLIGVTVEKGGEEMKRTRLQNKNRKKGIRMAHQVFDGRGKHGCDQRSQLSPAGKLWDWWLATCRKQEKK